MIIIPLLSTSAVISFLNAILPQLTIIGIAWGFREAYRLSRSLHEVESQANKNRKLILGLHDLEAPEDAING